MITGNIYRETYRTLHNIFVEHNNIFAIGEK